MIRAFNYHTGGVVNKVDNVVRTFSCAYSAADTLAGIYVSDSVINGDSILGTYLDTVTVAKTSISAMTVTTICHIGSAAGLLSLVIILLFNYVARAVASNICNLFHYVCCFNTEDGCDFFCCAIASGNTKVGSLSFALGESFCIAVAAAVSACATVCAGQAVTDSERFLILINAEEDRGKREYNCTYYSYNEK